ncbi:MAG: hypothetical protein RL284_180 [Bacteroidota bacterium]|jgi:hypothetical protein
MNQLIWVNQLDQLTEAVISNFGLLRHEDLYFKPDANRWSIAENLAHLIVVNRTYFPVIEQIRNNTYKVPFIGKIPFLPKLFGSVLIEYVKPEKEEAKVKTFPIWEPANFKEEGSILELFEKHQQALRNLRIENEDLIQRKQIIASPANNNIVYSLDDAFDVILLHEQRHFIQSKAVLALLDKNVI